MTEPKEALNKILQSERKRLKSSYPSDDFIFPVIEIIRSLDYNHFMLSHEKDNNSSFLLEKYKYGWSLAFKEFYQGLAMEDNVPLFSFDQPEREWIDSIIQHAGSIELCRQLLDHCKANLLALKRNGKFFTFHSLYDSIGLEYFEKLSLAYYHSINTQVLQHKIKPMMEQLPQMRKALENIVSVFQGKFIQYKATPEIDQFYSTFGYVNLMTTQVIDDFGEEDLFGGIQYSKYIDYAQDIFKAVIMHRDCCMAAAIKTSHKIYLKDILTYAFSKSSFINSYSEYSDWSKNEVDQILSCFTLDKSNINDHLSYPKVSAPPYIMLGHDTIIRSAYGSIDRPVLFLKRELKRRFPKDYFNAVNNREKRFRDEVYSLFPGDRIIKVDENINIKSGKLVTDIDGVLYDKERNTLGLIQLKWQDTFSYSMQERFSRISNLIPKSVEWIDKIKNWIANNDQRSIVKTLKLGNDIAKIADIHLFIISRNHVHFTNEKLDDRAIWASWYQVVEASANVKDFTNSNPIAELAAKLKFYSPEMRVLREKLPVIEDMEFNLSNYTISVN